MTKHIELYEQIWVELNKLGYDKNDEVIPYVMFNEVCDEVKVETDDIIDEFCEKFNVDVG